MRPSDINKNKLMILMLSGSQVLSLARIIYLWAFIIMTIGLCL